MKYLKVEWFVADNGDTSTKVYTENVLPAEVQALLMDEFVRQATMCCNRKRLLKITSGQKCLEDGQKS